MYMYISGVNIETIIYRLIHVISNQIFFPCRKFNPSVENNMEFFHVIFTLKYLKRRLKQRKKHEKDDEFRFYKYIHKHTQNLSPIYLCIYISTKRSFFLINLKKNSLII